MAKLSRLAICSLVSGVMSFLIFLLIPVAIVTGVMALNDIKKSHGVLRGKAFAFTGSIAGCLAILFAVSTAMGYHFNYRSFKAPSAAMSPTIKAGYRMVADMGAYGSKSPARGDIVFYELLDKGKRMLMCKRIVGLPGEEIEMRFGKVFANSLLVDIPGLPDDVTYLNGGDFGKAGQSFSVPGGAYFLLGDNPSESFDSRRHGAVDRSDIRGKYIFSYKDWLNKR